MRLGRLLLTGAVLMAGSVAMAQLTNADFETDTVGATSVTGWTTYQCTVEIVADARPGSSGTKSVEVTGSNNFAGLYQNVTTTPDTQWTFNAWVKFMSGPGAAAGDIGFYGSASPFDPNSNNYQITSSDTSWTEVSFFADFTGDAVGQDGLGDAQVSPDGGYVVRADDIVVSDVTNVKDWALY